MSLSAALWAMSPAAPLASALPPICHEEGDSGCPGGGGLTFHTLTVTASGDGTVEAAGYSTSCTSSNSPCTYQSLEGSDIELSRSAAGGWTLGAWGGSCSGSGATCTVTMDGNHSASSAFALQPPTITAPFSGQQVASTTGGSTSVQFSQPAATSFTCAVDAGSASPCASPWSSGHLASGSHTVVVTAKSGSVSSAAQRMWTVINVGHSSKIEGAPGYGSTVYSRHTDFDLSGVVSNPDDEPAHLFQCRLDAGIWVDCPSEGFDAADLVSAGELSTGPHTLAVRAGAEYIATRYYDTTPATRSWTVAEPETAIAGTPAEGATVTDTDAHFVLSDPSEAADVFFCSLDGAQPHECPWSLDVASDLNGGGPLAVGAHELRVWAGVGSDQGSPDLDSTPAVRTWTVEAPAPDPVPPGGGTAGGGSSPSGAGAGAPTPPATSPPVAIELSRSFYVRGHRLRIRKLLLSGVPVGGRVLVLCHGGKRRGCSFKRRTAKVRGDRANLRPLVRSLGLKPGAKLVIRVSAPGTAARTILVKVGRRLAKPRVVTR